MPQQQRVSQLTNTGVNPAAIVVYLNGLEYKDLANPLQSMV